MLPPVCLPYSPEFAPDQPGRGASTLAQLAALTGGKERVEIPSTWAELPPRPRYVEWAPWLLVLALTLLLIEILERRTGWISRLLPARKIAPPKAAETVKAGRSKMEPVRKPARRDATPVEAKGATPPAKSISAPAATDANIETLRKARERAGRRTTRDS